MLVTEHGAARPGAFQLYGEAGGSPGAGLTDAEARHALGLNVHVLLLALRRAILALKGRWSRVCHLVHPAELSATARHCPLGTYLQMDFRSPSMRAAGSSCTLQCTGANRSVCTVSGRYLLFIHAQTWINQAKSSQLKKHLGMYMLNSFPILLVAIHWAGGSRWELGQPWLWPF